MNQPRKINVWLIIGLTALIAVVVGYVILTVGKSTDNSSGTLTRIIQDPILFSVIGAIVTFLVIDRWRRLDSDVTELKREQNNYLKNIKQEHDTHINERFDALTKKAQNIESHVNNLVNDHPWIPYLTENQLIPNIPSCRIVLRTAEEFVSRGKVSLAYEYIYDWAKREQKQRSTNQVKDNATPLEGTADDFLDLAEYCERILSDEYLGLLVFRRGNAYASNSYLLRPYYVIRLLRHGSYEEAQKIAEQLRLVVDPNFWARFQIWRSGKPRYLRSDHEARSWAALSLAQAVNGKPKDALKSLQMARSKGSELPMQGELNSTEAELHIMMGNYTKADDLLNKMTNGGQTVADTDDAHYAVVRLYRSLGKDKQAEKMHKKFRLSNAQYGDLPFGMNSSRINGVPYSQSTKPHSQRTKTPPPQPSQNTPPPPSKADGSQKSL